MTTNIGALWKKEKNGKQFLSGTIEAFGQKIKVCVFKNDKKEKETQPDYRIVSFDALQPTTGTTAPHTATPERIVGTPEEESFDQF